ncbi:MAG: YbaN family protein [Armatimonadota bacterium]
MTSPHPVAKDEQPSAGQRLKKQALFVAGCLFLGLGLIGVVVPLLPTTPFLLLAAACFLKSSPRVYHWLMNSRFPGHYLRHYQSGAGVPRRVKFTAISVLWLTIGCSAVFVVESGLVRVLLALIALAVTAHIISLRPPRI